MSEESTSDLAREVTEWLREHWDPSLSVEEWWRLVGRAGWTAPHLTREEGGRGLPRSADRHVRAIFASHGALRPPGGLGLLMAAPTILRHGTPEQIARHVPPILEGRIAWCQLFSEPGAGSDLAGLGMRAVRDGDQWVFTGQKVWSSVARQAEYGMLIARTNPDVPKHAGISWFAFPLDQPGVTIRPLREMTGDAMFNEVFLDGARCDHADLIGGEGQGWAVTNTTLFFERTGIGAGGSHAHFPAPGPKGGALGRRAGDAAQDAPPVNNRVIAFPELVALARRMGRSDDPLIRQKLARLWSYLQIGLWNAQRAKAQAKSGAAASIASIGKISQTRIMKLSAEVALDILGPAGMLAGESGVEGGRYTDAFVFAPASSIYGGTDEIQRNIAAERTLGLPKEPRADDGLTFSEALRRQQGKPTRMTMRTLFAFTDEQQEFREMVRRFVEANSPETAVRDQMETERGFDRALWSKMAEQLGLQGLIVPEAHGGQGFGAVELAIVMEEMGRVLFCAPYLSTVVLAAQTLILAGDETANTALLPGIASGETIATLAFTEPNGRWDASGVEATARRDGAGWKIDGTKTYVLDGLTADVVLVAARSSAGVSLFHVPGDAAGLVRTPLDTLDPTRKLARLDFAGVAATAIGRDGAGADVLSALLDRAGVALAAEQVGGAQRCLDMAVAYAKDRVQFGRPIGSFQAIKHKCADMLLEVESARSAAYYAAWCAAASSDEAPAAAALAKSYCSDAYLQVAAQNIQIHGGIGFTWEHPAHLYYRRAKSSDLLFGDATEQRERLAQRLAI